MIKNNKNSLQPKLKDQIRQATSHKGAFTQGFFYHQLLRATG